MTISLGTVPAGTIIYIPFSTYDGATGASEACSGLAVTDIEIYKNGSTTQRASDAGYTLLDTDGIDFDGITGINGFSIDLNDNTDAGFYAIGSWYWVVVSSITADGQTVNFIAAIFRIGPAETVAGYSKSDVSHLLGTAPTEGAGGRLAAAFTKFFDKASPTGTINSLPDAVPDTAGGLPISDAGGLDLDAKLANTNEVTAARMGALTDLIDGGRLDLLVDAIKAKTDDISTAVVIAAAVRDVAIAGAAANSVGAAISDILTDTGTTLDTKINTIAGYLDTEIAAILAAVDTEIATLVSELAKVPKSDSTVSFNSTAIAAIQSGLALAATALSTAVWTNTKAGYLDEAISAAKTLTAAYDAAKTAAQATLSSESYAADGATPTHSQMLWMIWSALVDFSISGTTLTAKKQDGSAAMTFTLDDGTNPTSRTRAT